MAALHTHGDPLAAPARRSLRPGMRTCEQLVEQLFDDRAALSEARVRFDQLADATHPVEQLVSLVECVNLSRGGIVGVSPLVADEREHRDTWFAEHLDRLIGSGSSAPKGAQLCRVRIPGWSCLTDAYLNLVGTEGVERVATLDLRAHSTVSNGGWWGALTASDIAMLRSTMPSQVSVHGELYDGDPPELIRVAVALESDDPQLAALSRAALS